MKPHKHATLIKAWADGEVIQYRRVGQTDWNTFSSSTVPMWNDDSQYRVRPNIDLTIRISFVEGYILYSENQAQYCFFPTHRAVSEGICRDRMEVINLVLIQTNKDNLDL